MEVNKATLDKYRGVIRKIWNKLDEDIRIHKLIQEDFEWDLFLAKRLKFDFQIKFIEDKKSLNESIINDLEEMKNIINWN